MESSTMQRAKDFWEDQAAAGGEFSGFKVADDEIGFFRFQKEISTLSKILENKFNKRLRSLEFLDVGCARGHFTDLFLNFGKVDAFDFCENYVSFCKNKFKNNPAVNVFHDNILTFQSTKKYDVIFVGGVLMNLKDDDLDLAVRNLINGLRSDGIIIFREATMSRESIVTHEGSEFQMSLFRRKLSKYLNKFASLGLRVEEVILNDGCMYTKILFKYKQMFGISPDFFSNKFFDYVFLHLPLIFFLLLRRKKNFFTYHFIVVSL